MVVDGKAIAAEIIAKTALEVATMPKVPVLSIITCAPNFATRSYLALKRRKAAEAGLRVIVHELPDTATTAGLIETVKDAVREADGVVVQLPLPAQINREEVLASIPPSHDPDGFWYGKDERACLSPVVVAIQTIGEKTGVVWSRQRAVVIGNGRLVGAPAAHFLRQTGSEVAVVTAETAGARELIVQADVVVTGVGKPGLVTSDMVKDGVIIFDAGTSEDGGVLRGDVDRAVAKKASVFTPVPGGIGPITVAALLANTVTLAKRQWQGGD